MGAKTLPQVFVLGDSISNAYGPFLETMLQGKWHVNLEAPKGAYGSDSRQNVAYLAAMHAKSAIRADVLLLNCGLHDVKLDPQNLARGVQVPLEEHRANLNKLAAIVKQIGSALVWVRTTPVNEEQHNTKESTIHRRMTDVLRYNEVADEVMASNGTPMIDLFGFSLSLGPTHETLHDGRHFHEPFCRLQAAYIAGWLEGCGVNQSGGT